MKEKIANVVVWFCNLQTIEVVVEVFDVSWLNEVVLVGIRAKQLSLFYWAAEHKGKRTSQWD